MPETGHLDPQPAVYWPEARLAYDPEPDTGPVLISVDLTVAPERQAAFLEAMGQLRRSRLRTGATRWELYRDGERLNRFVELFSVPSWEEHLRQHAGRLTATDRVVEEAALAFSTRQRERITCCRRSGERRLRTLQITIECLKDFRKRGGS